ncbi:hypothetical protein [Bergeriella denitrificans]|uniref:Phage associated protein n=1 Tax=Bergeriella denitrificans TaxID=494 RepID=A0A378UJL1_BERDE|nr:hypothetical protein [Bergeriella denitrificans]STZ76859.1 Uncharacterised protein [Bergeriella denitrificans]
MSRNPNTISQTTRRQTNRAMREQARKQAQRRNIIIDTISAILTAMLVCFIISQCTTPAAAQTIEAEQAADAAEAAAAWAHVYTGVDLDNAAVAEPIE